MKLRDLVAKYANDDEEEELHPDWEHTFERMRRRTPDAAEARFARKNPALWALSRAFKGSRKEAAEKLEKAAAILKEGGSWEQSGGGATQGVYAMTPGALNIPSSGLGGMPTMNALVGMQMRPTLGGMQPMFGGGGQGLVNAYSSMARGGSPVGW